LLTAKRGGNVHDRGVVEIKVSSVRYCGPRNAADPEDAVSLFQCGNKLGQRICLEFKIVRIEPTH
jgi:hypothetical protein